MTVSSVSGTSASYQLLLQQLQQQQQIGGLIPHGHRHPQDGAVQTSAQSQQASGQSASAALSALTGGGDSDGDSDQSSPLNIVA